MCHENERVRGSCITFPPAGFSSAPCHLCCQFLLSSPDFLDKSKFSHKHSFCIKDAEQLTVTRNSLGKRLLR